MTPCKFTFDGDSPVFDGFAHGSTWNGFDNVAVMPATLTKIADWLRETGAPEESYADMLAIEAMPNGLISLGWGYCTSIMPPE